MTITVQQIDTVTKHYLIAAVWADSLEGTRPRIPKVTQAKAREICAAFIHKNAQLFEDAMSRGNSTGYGSHPDAGSPEAAFGHDLWLTSQGHGVGFHDRKELLPLDIGLGVEPEIGPDLCLLLSEAVDRAFGYGTVYPEFYRGWLYLNGGLKNV